MDKHLARLRKKRALINKIRNESYFLHPSSYKSCIYNKIIIRLQLSTRHQKTQLRVGPGPPMAGCMAKELSGLVSAPWQSGKSLQLVGQREDFKTALGSIWGSSPKCCCQSLCFQGVSQLPPASLGGSLRLAGRSEPCSFQLNCLCAGTWIM